MLLSQKHVSERLILNSRRASINAGEAAENEERSQFETDGGFKLPQGPAAPLNEPGTHPLRKVGLGVSDPPPPAPLDVIEIAWTPITKDVVGTIVQVLVDDDDGKPPIRVVDLVDNRLGPKLTETICAAIEGSQVEEILIRYNDIGRLGCEAVASVVNVSTRLRFVDLRGNKLVPMDCRKFFRSLAVSQSVQRLGLSNNNLGPEGAILLATALEKNSFITQLDVSMNNIGVDGVTSLASLLKLPAHPLRNLNIWGNRLGAQGMDVLFDAVAANRSLTVLSAGNNNAGAGIGPAIARMLGANSTLTSLELRSNSMTAETLLKLSDGLAQNETVATLQLGGNPLSSGPTSSQISAGLDAFVKRLVKNETMTSLDLASCELGTGGVIRVAGLVGASTSLKELNLSGNDAEDEAAAAIAKALLPSKSLTSLDLSTNRLTMDGVSDLLDAVQANTKILHLALQGNAEEVGRVVQEKVDAMLADRRRKHK
ncbi:leucine-rich repeat protein, putative [Bodo saltans]|uniref:Leucine-rich repeat protein, putative n=1 Tax=Bodo saltans TaxID=75058 RepID=A0A0S4JPV3_BODSA|nr:leucine-rich repeat protein, putative [Bodo saltans]|eukprot:CUG92168.1 leucine-rich repeat protein, putative [Bodo saltans]